MTPAAEFQGLRTRMGRMQVLCKGGVRALAGGGLAIVTSRPSPPLTGVTEGSHRDASRGVLAASLRRSDRPARRAPGGLDSSTFAAAPSRPSAGGFASGPAVASYGRAEPDGLARFFRWPHGLPTPARPRGADADHAGLAPLHRVSAGAGAHPVPWDPVAATDPSNASTAIRARGRGVRPGRRPGDARRAGVSEGAGAATIVAGAGTISWPSRRTRRTGTRRSRTGSRRRGRPPARVASAAESTRGRHETRACQGIAHPRGSREAAWGRGLAVGSPQGAASPRGGGRRGRRVPLRRRQLRGYGSGGSGGIPRSLGNRELLAPGAGRGGS